MNAKKAQAMRMIVYLLTMIIVVFVLIFGYKAVKSLTTQTQTASELKFVNELISDLYRIFLQY